MLVFFPIVRNEAHQYLKVFRLMSKILFIKPRFLKREFPFITSPRGPLSISAIITKIDQTMKIIKIIHEQFYDLRVSLAGPWLSAHSSEALGTLDPDFTGIREGEFSF